MAFWSSTVKLEPKEYSYMSDLKDANNNELDMFNDDKFIFSVAQGLAKFFDLLVSDGFTMFNAIIPSEAVAGFLLRTNDALLKEVCRTHQGVDEPRV